MYKHAWEFNNEYFFLIEIDREEAQVVMTILKPQRTYLRVSNTIKPYRRFVLLETSNHFKHLGKDQIILFPIHIYRKYSILIVIELILAKSKQIPILSTLGTSTSCNVYQSVDL